MCAELKSMEASRYITLKDIILTGYGIKKLKETTQIPPLTAALSCIPGLATLLADVYHNKH